MNQPKLFLAEGTCLLPSLWYSIVETENRQRRLPTVQAWLSVAPLDGSSTPVPVSRAWVLGFCYWCGNLTQTDVHTGEAPGFRTAL